MDVSACLSAFKPVQATRTNNLAGLEPQQILDLFSLLFLLSPNGLAEEIANNDGLSTFLMANISLLDKYFQFIDYDRQRVAIELNGEELVLEQNTSNNIPRLQIRYRSYFQEIPRPMTMDAWATQLLATLMDEDGALGKLFRAHVPSIDFDFFIDVSTENLNFNFVDLRSDEIDLSEIFESARYANFSNAVLQQMNMANIDLTGANFNKADLTDANLQGTILDDANLSGAAIKGADFTGASLKRSNLRGLELTTLKLTPQQLSEANFSAALLNGVTVNRPSLNNYFVTLAEKGEKNLSHIDFSGAIFVNCDLNQVDFTNSNFTAAQFINVNLTGAKLNGADFTAATFNSTDITDADITNADITSANFICTKFNGVDSSEIDPITYLNNTDAFLTMLETTIGKIDDRFATLKLRLVHTIIDELVGENINKIRVDFALFLFSKPIFADDEKIFEFIVDAFSDFIPFDPVEYDANNQAIEISGKLELRFLLHQVIATLKALPESFADYLEQHGAFVEQLVGLGQNINNVAISELARDLYKLVKEFLEQIIVSTEV